MNRDEQLREERKTYFENGGFVEDFPPDGTSIEYPHCDPRVLHSPGVCDVCDKSASKLQTQRIDRGLPFTDELAPEDPLLPGSDRTRESADSWGGNRSDPGPHRPSRIDPMGYRVPPAPPREKARRTHGAFVTKVLRIWRALKLRYAEWR